MFNVNIAIFDQSLEAYNKIAFYNSINNIEEIIRLNYINRNHFQFLYKKENKYLSSEFSKELNNTDLKSKLEQKIEANKFNIFQDFEINKKLFFSEDYVKYNIILVPNKYNEIYVYLKSIKDKYNKKEILPLRMYDSKLVPNPSTQHKKRTNFRNDAKKNYLINNENRLCYRDKPQTNKVDNKILIKKIPFKYEVIPILRNLYITSSVHNNFNKMKESILITEFYWNSVT